MSDLPYMTPEFVPGEATVAGMHLDALAAEYTDPNAGFETADAVIQNLCDRIERGEISELEAANIATLLDL